MRKNFWIYISCIILIFIIGASTIFNFNKPKTIKKTYEKVRVAEVAHTIFYAPMYIAIEKGFFKDEGIDIELILANGADKVTAALLSNDADIGFSGSEATIYVYNSKEKDYLKTFARLTQKDGSFIVSRKKIKNFSLNDLKGKKIIGGRAGGMPEMTLEYALKQNGINPKKDLEIDTSIAFAAMGGAFIGGEGDFVTLFEPTASTIEKQGYGYVVASVGEIAGEVPYTSFSARISYLKEHPETIKKFNKAIQRGLDYVFENSNNKIATDIIKQFPDSSTSEIESAIKRYREINAWPKTTSFSKKDFDHLQDIMIDYKEINTKVPYKDLFYNIK